MTRLPSTLLLMAGMLLMAACTPTTPGDRATATADVRGEDVPTGSILPGGMAGSDVQRSSGGALNGGPGGFSGGYQNNLH